MKIIDRTLDQDIDGLCYSSGCGLDSPGSEQDPVVRSCECGNKLLLDYNQSCIISLLLTLHSQKLHIIEAYIICSFITIVISSIVYSILVVEKMVK
jgi:hypothetical protein